MSICLILSLVTLNTFPTSSNVLPFPLSSPNLSFNTIASLSVRFFITSSNCSFNNRYDADSCGAGVSSSGKKSPKCVSSSSPTGVSNDTGSTDIL